MTYDLFGGTLNLAQSVMDNAVGCYAYGNIFWCM